MRGFAVGFSMLLLVARPAYAQRAPKGEKPAAASADRSEAGRLKREADALMDQDRYVDALALYQKAYDLTNDPALLYNQGRALEAMGDYPDALDKLEKFEHDASPSLRAKVPGLRDLLVDLRGRIATLVVTTNAPGARLLVREKAAGTIQKELSLRTRAGAATIEVVAEGYTSFKKDVELLGGKTVRVDATLHPKKGDPLIVVKTRPPAAIAVDGKAIGRSPLEYRVAAGAHVLVAEADGKEPQKVPMTLALGDRRELDLELKPKPGVFSRWWFWTGVAVVVAGGVAAGIALTTERSADAGTFGSGTIAGP